MQRTEATDALRAGVRAELPELEEIADDDLRNKVVEAWATSLAQEGFGAISEIQGAGNPDHTVLKEGTQADHLRGVAQLAMRIADQLKELKPELPLNRDVAVAGALVHDVGKPMEFSAARRERWQQAPHVAGFPATRHSVHGWHICKTVGLPDEVAHIAVNHSREGQFVQRSLECTIVYYADHAYWQCLNAGGLLDDRFPS